MQAVQLESEVNAAADLLGIAWPMHLIVVPDSVARYLLSQLSVKPIWMKYKGACHTLPSSIGCAVQCP